MARNLETSLTIRFRDQLSGAATRAFDTLSQRSQRAAQAVTGVATASTGLAQTARAPQAVSRALQDLATQGKSTSQIVSGTTKAVQAIGGAAQAPQGVSRAMLELARQSKIAEQALGTTTNRAQALGRSPAPSRTIDGLRQMASQAQAAERAMRAVATTARGAMTVGGRSLQAYGTALAGGAAGAAVMATPMRRVASYDMRLAHMANTAFNETEIDGRRLSVDEQLQRRRTGKTQLEGYIRTATLEGGTRDDNAAALDKLIARGIFSPKEAGQLLPMISKAATAAGSSADEMTDVVMAAVQNAKVPVEQIPKALGMALKAGQVGGFELKDMAAWLPKMLSMGGAAGLRGTSGLSKILAVSQMAVTAAGGSDEAGNNVVNFLQKITSADTAADFKKISAKSFGDKRKGEKGIDLYGTLMKARAEGMDSVDAFTSLVGKVAQADPAFDKLKKQVEASKDDKDKSAMYGSMADILMAKGIGKTLQDRQAMLGVLPILFDPSKLSEFDKTIGAGGAQDIETNQRFIKEQAGFKFQQAENVKDQGQYDSLGALNSVVGDVASRLAEYGAQYPGLTASITGATVALNALTAAAAVGGLANILGGKLGGAAAARALPAAGAVAAQALPAAASAAASIGVAPIIAATTFGGVLAAVGSRITDEDRANATRNQVKSRFGMDLNATNRNVPNPVAPLPQLTPAPGQSSAYAARLDAAATKMQTAANTPQTVHVTGEFRVNGADLVAVVDQRQTNTARRQ